MAPTLHAQAVAPASSSVAEQPRPAAGPVTRGTGRGSRGRAGGAKGAASPGGAARSQPCPLLSDLTESSIRTGRGAGSPRLPILLPGARGGAARPGWRRLPAAAGKGKRKRRERTALEGVRGRGVRGGGWVLLPAPARSSPPRPGDPPGLILPPRALLPALLPAPSLIFHPLLIPFPRSGLSCPGNESPVPAAARHTRAFPSSPWRSAPRNL